MISFLAEFRRANFSIRLVDFIKKTQMLRTYSDLIKTQWLETHELEDLQLQRTRNLLIHAFENVPYYQQLFQEKDFDPYSFRQFADLQVLPVLTKATIRENFELLLAGNARAFKPRRRQTSGSTGEPLVYYGDSLSHSCPWANNWRAFSVIGFRPGNHFVTLSGGALIPATTPLKQKIYVLLMGMRQLPAYHLSLKEMDQYVTILESKSGYDLMYAYASAAYLFARHLLERVKDHRIRLRAIFTTSEILSPYQREIIERAFRCPVYDTYGNNETSLCAFECEAHRGLHYSMEHSYLEVLDEEGQPRKTGEIGRFIATNLFNYAMPLIRYDTGDLGAFSEEECTCNRGLRKIDKVLGRSRDFICTPDGRRIHGAFFNHFEPFYRTPWIVAWHIKQDKLDHITISLCPSGQPIQKDLEDIRILLQKGLGHQMQIDFVIDERLHITAAGKQKLIESSVFEQ